MHTHNSVKPPKTEGAYVQWNGSQARVIISIIWILAVFSRILFWDPQKKPYEFPPYIISLLETKKYLFAQYDQRLAGRRYYSRLVLSTKWFDISKGNACVVCCRSSYKITLIGAWSTKISINILPSDTINSVSLSKYSFAKSAYNVKLC